MFATTSAAAVTAIGVRIERKEDDAIHLEDIKTPSDDDHDQGEVDVDIDVESLGHDEKPRRSTEASNNSDQVEVAASEDPTPAASIHRSLSMLQPEEATSYDDTPPSSAMELPPVDGGRQAWTFLSVAVVLEMLIWGLGNSYGAFQDYHLYSRQSPLYGSPSAATAAAGILITAGQYVAPFIFLGLLNAYPHAIKLFQAITISTSAIGLIGASFRPTVPGVIVLQGFVSGWAGGAFYTPAMIFLPQWFDKNRGMATGIIFLGGGVGGVIWPFLINLMLQSVGFSWTLRILAAMQFTLGSVIAYFLRPRLPVRAPATSDGTGSRHDPTRRRRTILRNILPSHNKALNTPLGIANCLMQFLQNAAYWTVSFFIAPYASSLGLKGAMPTALLAAFNASSAISYVAVGRACDVIPHTLIVPVLGLSGGLLVALLLGFARTVGPLFAFAVLYGLLNGGFSTTMSPMARETARQLEQRAAKHHSAVFLEIMAIRGAGGILGPLISSAMYKSQQIGSGADEQSATTSSTSRFSANASYGSHGIGPIVIFATALSGGVAIVSLLALLFGDSNIKRKRRRS